MADEHVTTTRTPDGGAQTTIIHEHRSGGSGWLIGLVLLLAVVIGVYFLAQSSGSESARDNAIANAAGEVGTAARKAGNAAQDAADSLKD